MSSRSKSGWDEYMEKIVVTGVGCITSMGYNARDFWQSMVETRSGISRISRFDPIHYRTQIAAEIATDDISQLVGFNVANLSRNTQFAMAAASEVFADCGLSCNERISRDIGICLGSGLGGIYFSEESMARLLEYGPHRLSPMTVPFVDPNSIVSQVAMKWGITGQQLTVTTACSSSAHAIGIAMDMIRSGRAELVLTGGVEATVSPLVFAGFDRLRAMSAQNDSPQDACRPFSNGRDGFVIAEGGAMLMLEKEASAKSRGARIYAEIAGYGASGGGFHAVMPRPDGSDSMKAMRLALDDAALAPEQIDLLNPHGTGTKLNDDAEFAALDAVFGKHLEALEVTPTKQLTGHMLGAAAALEAVHVVKSIQTSSVTAIRCCDNAYGLRINSQKTFKRPIRYAMSNSFGFGNNNVSLIFGGIHED